MTLYGGVISVAYAFTYLKIVKKVSMHDKNIRGSRFQPCGTPRLEIVVSQNVPAFNDVFTVRYEIA